MRWAMFIWYCDRWVKSPSHFSQDAALRVQQFNEYKLGVPCYITEIKE